MKRALFAALLLAAAATTHAAGYAINDQGLRSLSQGLATPATLEGPETLFFDPAGMAAIDGWSLATGLTEIRLDLDTTSATTGATASSSRDHFEIPHLYVARGGLGAKKRWAFGTSVNAPFGLATQWPKDFEGRFISRIADLKTMQVAGLAAVKLPRGWSLGFGPTWTMGDVHLVRDVDLTVFRRGHQAEADLTGDGSTLGWRFGARWRGPKGWSLGVTWHGQTKLHLKGNVDYTVVPLGAYTLDQLIATLFVDGPASTSLTLPGTGWIGVGRVRDTWSWEIAATWTNWSVMKDVVIDLVPISAGGEQLVTTQFLHPTWHDAWAYRAGCRVAVGTNWSLAAGLGWDETPVPVKTADPLLPDADRLAVTMGATWTHGRFALDFGVQSLTFSDLDTSGVGNPLEATYEASGLAFGTTASWRWGGSAAR